MSKNKSEHNCEFTFSDLMKSICVDYRIIEQKMIVTNSKGEHLPPDEKEIVQQMHGYVDGNERFTLYDSDFSLYINNKKHIPSYWGRDCESASSCMAYYILSALIGKCQISKNYSFFNSLCCVIKEYYSKANFSKDKFSQMENLIQTIADFVQSGQHNCSLLLDFPKHDIKLEKYHNNIHRNEQMIRHGKLTPLAKSLYQLLYELLFIAINNSYQIRCNQKTKNDTKQEPHEKINNDGKLAEISPSINILSRDGLVKKIINALKQNEKKPLRKTVLLYGDGGIGKSYIADRVFCMLKEYGYLVFYECVDDTIVATLKRSGIIFQDNNSSPKAIILDHVKYAMDELDTLRQLLNRNFLILIIARNKIANSEYFEEYMVPSFTSDKLCDYAIDRIRKNRLDLKQADEEELRVVISQIAEEIRCNTDLFIQISNIICDGILDADEILEILRQRESEHIFVGNKSLSQYYFNLYFSQKSPITDDQRLYICLMSLLPPRLVTKAISHLIFANIDPHDRARQMLSGIDIVKSSHICEEIWLEQEENIYIYVHDNIRTAVEICLPTLAKAINGFDIQLGVFVENIVNQMIQSQKLVNQDFKSDKESYNAFICWQYIGSYIVRHPIAVLNELFKHNQTAIFKLIIAAFDGYYFANVYDRAAEMINSAINLCGKESLPIEIIKRSYKIALAAGRENLVCDSSLESATTSTEMKKIMAWRCLENRELWEEDNFVQIESASNLLGFSRAEVFEMKKDYTTLAEFADSLRARNAYIFDIIPAKTTVRLHILTNDTIIMRQIDIQKDSRQVSDLFRGTFVLPKVSWKCTPNEMIQNGLKINRYEGWGIFVKEAGEEKLISYIDKKILKPSEDEDRLTQIHTGTQIGFAATHVDYRSRGLVRFLLNNIDMCHPNENHYFTTHDQNGSMNRVAEAVGYECLLSKSVRNRVIEHISTLYYWKPALNTAVDVGKRGSER